jgi:hypothetical protein
MPYIPVKQSFLKEKEIVFNYSYRHKKSVSPRKAPCDGLLLAEQADGKFPIRKIGFPDRYDGRPFLLK